MHGEKAALLDLGGDLAQHDLHAFMLVKRGAESLALLHIGMRDLEAALGQPGPAHAMGEARGA